MDQLNFTLVTHFFQYSVRVCLPELPAPMLKQALLWDLNHMAVFVSNKIRARVKHFQMSCSLIYIRLSPVSLFYTHLVPLKPRHLNQPLKKMLAPILQCKLSSDTLPVFFFSLSFCTATQRKFLLSSMAPNSSPFVSRSNSQTRTPSLSPSHVWVSGV